MARKQQLCRTSIIKHPSGESIKTPLLVPSFSSKGFRIRKMHDHEQSEATAYLKAVGEQITETVLISAYDIYHKLIIPPLSSSCFYNPQLTFIDSGGYETLEEYDLSEVYKYPIIKRQWSLTNYREVLDSLNRRIPAVIVSYDNGNEKKIPIDQQIKNAKKLFENNPHNLHDLLFKPIKKNKLLDVDDIIKYLPHLKGIRILGFTEKELGNSTLERAINIAKIRRAMDRVELTDSSIHVFGSLDPLMCIIYFLAGAEIFDGLTWLRYGYYKGKAIYHQNYSVLEIGVQEKDSIATSMTINKNLIYLRELQIRMRALASNMDFSIFEDEERNRIQLINNQLNNL